ncbi:MAG TPA: RNA 2',3'-cyclic phosphodiesterase [Steroidobacteraceae bacterium]|nr:RNA 2',3'-cyclic phosphodiesterase [Steroidobacteraceae bacterium]
MSGGGQSPAPLAREPTRRLFFALWPDAEQRGALHSATRKSVKSCGGRPVPVQSLHVTLAFLGSVPEGRVPELDRIARRVADAFPARAQPLLLTFDRLTHWARPQILCALGTEEPAADADAASAPALSATLKNETAAAGFSPDLKPFRAHVTVARKVAHAPSALALQPVLWRFEAFALIESRTDPAGPVYSVIESYLLVKAEKAR